jgi:hypothetical protein
LVELIQRFRASLGLPLPADDELRTDSVSFASNARFSDGYGWLGELLGGAVVADDGAVLQCQGALVKAELAGLPGCRADQAGVGLPFGAEMLAAGFPDWIESEADGRIRGWLFPVPVLGSTDAWGWQALDEDLLEAPPEITDP